MAFPTSYVNAYAIAESMKGNVNFDTDTFKWDAYTDSLGATDKDAMEAIGSAPFDSNKVDYTDATPAGAATMTNPGLTVGSNKIVFDDGSETGVEWTGATFTARGIVGFDDTHASDLVIAAINFGSDKSVIAGTLTVTWDASNGVFAITV